jgi:hypothetical protein
MPDQKKKYQAPQVFEYGPIGDHTFHTPGGTKGCTTDCHIDKWGELSANPAS